MSRGGTPPVDTMCRNVTCRAGTCVASDVAVMNNTQELDALTQVLADAGALPCVHCGKRAAVHTEAEDADRMASDLVWCFECGHEERVA